jgi:hypothetical protein
MRHGKIERREKEDLIIRRRCISKLRWRSERFWMGRKMALE